MSDIGENPTNYCSFIFLHHPAETASITNITQAPGSAAAEIELSPAVGEKSNWMYYNPTKLQ